VQAQSQQIRQPIFNVPAVVVAILVACAAVHGLRQLVSSSDNGWWTAALAFIPARYGPLYEDLPGGGIARFTSLLTHLFVHGDLTHLAVNGAWLLAFGTPVARRTSVVGFLGLFALCGAAGALLYLAFHGLEVTLLIGASGAISGLMGAAFRFLYNGLDGGPRGFADATRYAPLSTLGDTLRDRRVMTSVAIWSVLNVLLALGASGLTDAGGIAWEAHIGGFFAGLFLYGWFDQPPPRPLPSDDPYSPDEPEQSAPA
jgi:membrane associated rhomboid family serine protease